MSNRALIPISQTLLVCFFLCALEATVFAKRRTPAGGRLAVVVDERLSALRASPELSGSVVATNKPWRVRGYHRRKNQSRGSRIFSRQLNQTDWRLDTARCC